MKRVAVVLAAVPLLSASLPLYAQPVAPNGSTVCLNTRDIQRTQVLNDRTILFHMRDGKIWRNELRSACPMLSVSPYSEKLTTDLVCANQQFIHVTLTGDDCALGSFTEVTPQR